MNQPIANPPAAAQATEIDRQLRTLGAQARTQLVLQRSGLILAVALAAALGWGLLDYWLRVPPAVRWIAFGVGGVGLAWQLFQQMVPAWRFRPTATQLALRMERASPPDAGLKSLLASGLELGGANARDAVTGAVERSLRAVAAKNAVDRFPPARARTRLLKPDRLVRAFAALVAVALPLVTLQAFSPSLARIGTLRVLAPWGSAQWPKRTGVADANPVIAHALGSPIALQAVSFRKGGDGADVRIEYRAVVNDEAGPWRRAILSKQSKRTTVERPGGGDAVEGPLHELLLETTSLAPAAAIKDGLPIRLEYRFRSADDETPLWSTRLIAPPAITRATVSITPPPYASWCAGQQGKDAAIKTIDTVFGTHAASDPRIRGGTALNGSMVSLRLYLSRPLQSPVQGTAGEISATDMLRSTFPALGEIPGLEFEASVVTLADGDAETKVSVWTLAWAATASLSTPIVLRDDFGIRATTDPLFDLEVTEDRPPQPAIIEPAQDESVLATAVVAVMGESRDDVGVATLSLLHQVERQPTGSAGAPAEPHGDPAESASAQPVDCPTRIECPATFTIADYGLLPGDALVLTARTTDLRMAATGAPAVVSAMRRLRIISESTFAEELQNELAAMRDAAVRLRKEQGDVSAQRLQASESTESASEAASKQAAVAERIEPLTRLGDRLMERIARNRPGDNSLAETVQDANELANEAAAAADGAAEALEQLGEESPTQTRESLARATAEQQTAAETALDELVSMLDQGREGHAAKRAIERLLTEQRQTTAQTTSAAAQTQGKSVESLSPTQREELDRLAARQQGLSQRTQAALDALEQQAEELKAADPGQAKSMEAAAQKGRDSRAAAEQQQASKQIQQNQTGQAQESQQQAEESLEQVLEELNRTQERRDEALRRVLAEISEELERLVEGQTKELGRASAALSASPAEPIDGGMIDISRATIAVNGRVAKELRAGGDLPALLDSAINAQSAAVASLRTEPADFVDAIENEQRSLSRLKDAVEELARLGEEAEEKEQDRKRRELLKEYQESLEIQAAIKAEVSAFTRKALARKDRAVLRVSGQVQDDLRLRLLKLREETSEMESAKMFSFAHDRLDAAMADASNGLKSGRADAVVDAAQASAIRILASLVEALRPAQDDDDGLREDEQAGDAGGGGGGAQEPPLIPPIAELKLLRAMQMEAFELTRTAGDALNPAAVSVAAELQTSLAERAAEIQKALEEAERPPAPALDPAIDPAVNDPADPPKEPLGPAFGFRETGGMDPTQHIFRTRCAMRAAAIIKPFHWMLAA